MPILRLLKLLENLELIFCCWPFIENGLTEFVARGLDQLPLSTHFLMSGTAEGITFDPILRHACECGSSAVSRKAGFPFTRE